MKQVISAVVAGLVLTGIPQSILAGCTHYPVYSYAAPVVVQKEVIVVKQVPVYVAAFTPVVSVGYAVPGVAVAPVAAPAVQAASAPHDACADLRGRVAQLERLLQGQAQGAGQGASAQATVTPPNAPAQARAEAVQAPQASGYAAVIAQRCAECHTAGKLKKTDIALCDEAGQPLALSPEMVKKVLASVKGKAGAPPTMPKGKPPLDDASFGAMLELLDQ